MNLVLSGVGIVQNIQSSYYWFQFGRCISVTLSAGYILIDVLTGDWKHFIYKRNLMKMIVDHLHSELGIQDHIDLVGDDQVDDTIHPIVPDKQVLVPTVTNVTEA